MFVYSFQQFKKMSSSSSEGEQRRNELNRNIPVGSSDYPLPKSKKKKKDKKKKRKHKRSTKKNSKNNISNKNLKKKRSMNPFENQQESSDQDQQSVITQDKDNVNSRIISKSAGHDVISLQSIAVSDDQSNNVDNAPSIHDSDNDILDSQHGGRIPNPTTDQASQHYDLRNIESQQEPERDESSQSTDLDVEGNQEDQSEVKEEKDEIKREEDMTLEEMITAQNKTISQKQRGNWSLIIPNLQSQFQRMNINAAIFKEDAHFLFDILYDVWQNKSKKKKIQSIIGVYEEPWHAHAQIKCSKNIAISKLNWFNVSAKDIFKKLWKYNREKSKVSKRIAKDLAKINKDHDVKDRLVVWISDNWKNHSDAYIEYMFKEANYDTKRKFDDKKAYCKGINQPQIQQQIDDFQNKQSKPKKNSLYEMIRSELRGCKDQESLTKMIRKLKHDTIICLHRNNGYTDMCNANAERIEIETLSKKTRSRKKPIPLPKIDWTEDDFFYGPEVKDRTRLPLIMNTIGRWIIHFPIERNSQKEANLIYLQAPATGSGKTTACRILNIQFNGFRLPNNGMYLGAGYNHSCGIIWLDAVSEDHFGKDHKGIPCHIFEGLAGGDKVQLQVKFSDPVTTNQQPCIFAGQYALHSLGYFKDNQEKIDMLKARVLVIQCDDDPTQEESFNLINWHLQKIWNIEYPHGKPMKGKKQKIVKFNHVIKPGDKNMEIYLDTKKKEKSKILKDHQKIKYKKYFRIPDYVNQDELKCLDMDEDSDMDYNNNENQNNANRNHPGNHNKNKKRSNSKQETDPASDTQEDVQHNVDLQDNDAQDSKIEHHDVEEKHESEKKQPHILFGGTRRDATSDDHDEQSPTQQSRRSESRRSQSPRSQSMSESSKCSSKSSPKSKKNTQRSTGGRKRKRRRQQMDNSNSESSGLSDFDLTKKKRKKRKISTAAYHALLFDDTDD